MAKTCVARAAFGISASGIWACGVIMAGIFGGGGASAQNASTPNASGLYVKGGLGFNTIPDADLTSVAPGAVDPISFDNGFAATVAAGKSWSAISLEAEIAVRATDGEVDEQDRFLGADVRTAAFFVNGWYAIPVTERWSGYAGGGVGVERSEIRFQDELETVLTAVEQETEFVWQLGFGGHYALGNGVLVGGGYRYLGQGDGDFAGVFALDPFDQHTLLAEVVVPLP